MLLIESRHDSKRCPMIYSRKRGQAKFESFHVQQTGCTGHIRSSTRAWAADAASVAQAVIPHRQQEAGSPPLFHGECCLAPPVTGRLGLP